METLAHCPHVIAAPQSMSRELLLFATVKFSVMQAHGRFFAPPPPSPPSLPSASTAHYCLDELANRHPRRSN